MKKLVALLLALLMLFAISACGGKTGQEAPESSGKENSAPETQEPEKFENKIELSLDKVSYEQAERIEVTMNFAEVDKDSAIIVIVSADTPHGELAPAEEKCEEYRWLADFDETPFYLWAPEKYGAFDVRVYAGSENEELASVTFAAGSAEHPGGENAGGNTSGEGGVLTEGGDCTQKQMEDTIVSYLSKISGLSSLTLGGGSRIQYDKAGDVLNDFDIWTIYDPALDNDGMYETMNSQLTAAGFTYEKDAIGRHVWYVDGGGERKGILLWPDDEESPDGYYILMMTYVE